MSVSAIVPRIESPTLREQALEAFRQQRAEEIADELRREQERLHFNAVYLQAELENKLGIRIQYHQVQHSRFVAYAVVDGLVLAHSGGRLFLFDAGDEVDDVDAGREVTDLASLGSYLAAAL